MRHRRALPASGGPLVDKLSCHVFPFPATAWAGMNTMAMQETELLGDAELVELCRNGDRDAFGRIVERYQSLVCALAYSACGDLARSEDLAQETFLAAWRQLATLREPARLKNWLCGIVRNLFHNSLRAQARNPLASAVVLEDEVAAGPDWEVPSGEAMSKEEAAILWRVLETLPRAYRDPLVLFYRSGDSTAEVAEALELSEEAVRQRLARGRAMLNERVTRLVESGLRRSNPTKTFTLAVLAALPMASAQAGAGGSAVITTAKSTGVFKTASGLSALIATIANLVPLLGGGVGLWGYVENTRTARERRFLSWSALALVFWAVGSLAVAGIVVAQWDLINPASRFSDAVGLSLLWLAFSAPLDVWAIWMAVRQKRIRAEEGELTPRPVALRRRGYRLAMFGSLAAMIFGATAWLFAQAARANDSVSLVSLLALCVAGSVASALVAVKRPANCAQVFVVVGWGLLIVNLLTVNLRWDTWQGTAALHEWPAQPAPPGVNLLIFVVFASVRAGWFLKLHFLNARTARRDAMAALAVYLVVMITGVVGFRAATALDAWELQNAQIMTSEFQTDGTIHFLLLAVWPNRSPTPLREARFQNSDFVHLERMTDQRGRPLAFTVEHRDDRFHYFVPLSDAVPPGQWVHLRSEGYMTGRIRELNENIHEFVEHHWPGAAATLRVETYRLPAGARVLETRPADLTRRQLVDGRLELRTRKLIPPGGNISVRIRFQPPSTSP